MLGLSAPVARFIRSIAAAAISAGVVAGLANVEALNDFVLEVLGKANIENGNVVAVIVVAAVAAALQALDKQFRDAGTYPDLLEK